MIALTWATLSALILSASAGTKLWDGSFNNYASAADFDKCKSRKLLYVFFDNHSRTYLQGLGPTKSVPING
jgi:hypothetical protein